MHLILLTGLVVPIYAASASWGQIGNTDVIAANVASWQVARSATLDLSEHAVIVEDVETLGNWYVELDDGRVVSNRPPGLIGLGIPAYLLFQSENFLVGPGTAVALLTTTIAVITVWNALIPLLGLNNATISALVLAFGTSTWWISSAQLWPHGPGQIWAAMAIVALASSSYGGIGWAFAASITTRPITGLFAVFTGLFESARLRMWKPFTRVMGPASVGAAVVVLYNRLVFGSWSLRGGYSDAFTTGAIERFEISEYLSNVYAMFLGLPHGVLTMSPIIGVTLIGAVLARNELPGWSVSLALSGLMYLLAHAALNRASAGLAVLYRYPLEAIVLASPVLAIGAKWLWERNKLTGILLLFAAVTSIALQALNAFHPSCPAPPCLLHWL